MSESHKVLRRNSRATETNNAQNSNYFLYIFCFILFKFQNLSFCSNLCFRLRDPRRFANRFVRNSSRAQMTDVDLSSSNFSLETLSKLKVVDLKRIAADLQIKKLPKLKRDIIQIILRHSREESNSNSNCQKEPELSEKIQYNDNVDNLKIFEAMILAQMKKCQHDFNDLPKLLDSPVTEEVEEIILKIFDRFCGEIS